jgi:hypothetical protein
MVELSDVSFRGCRLCTLSDARPFAVDTLVAIGFVLPQRKIALAKGRVVRRVDDAHGGSVGLIINRANETFYEFVATLAEPSPFAAAG